MRREGQEDGEDGGREENTTVTRQPSKGPTAFITIVPFTTTSITLNASFPLAQSRWTIRANAIRGKGDESSESL